MALLSSLSLAMVVLAGLAAGYLAASLLLLRRPELLHGRRKIDLLGRFPRCVHISHRGGAAEMYENTLLAFDRAVREGATDMLEVDVHRTRDGVVVVIHDDSLERLCGDPRRVNEVRYRDLPPIKRRIPIDFEAGHFFEDDSVTEEDR